MHDGGVVLPRLTGMAGLTGWRRALAMIVAGGIAGLGLVPFSLWPLTLAALVLALLALMRARTLGQAALIGWLFGTGYFAVTLHWIVDPFLVDVARHGWMAPFALLFSATGFALFWGAAFGVAQAVGRTPARRGLAAVVTMGLAELARGYVLTGFPWAMIGYVWSENAAAQLVALVGSYGLTVLTLAGCAMVALLLAQRRPVAAALAALVLGVAPIGAGALLLTPERAAEADAPLIRLIQPNAPQAEKWDPDHVLTFFERQMDFTAAPGVPDLTVWPETAIPWLAEPGLPALAAISDAAGGRPVIIGAQRLSGPRAFNSLLVLGPSGEIETTYDKHHLVPFGEFVPLGGLARLIGLNSFAARDGYGFSAGPGPVLLDLGRLGHALPLICYEAVFPQDLRGTDRPDWLLQITNDAWFGIFAGPQQHLAQARLRSIEQGLPMIRVANTGISGVIDAEGRLLNSIPLGQAGFLDVRLPEARPATLYSRTGDLPLALLLACLLGGLVVLRLRDCD